MRFFVMTQDGKAIEWEILAQQFIHRTSDSFKFRFNCMPIKEKNLFFGSIFDVQSDWTLDALNSWIGASGDGLNITSTWDKLSEKVYVPVTNHIVSLQFFYPMG